MGTNKRHKSGPRAPPPPKAEVEVKKGTFLTYQGDRESFTCDQSMVVAMTWSWGKGETFEAGTVAARLVRFVGDDEDEHRQWRPDALLISGFDGKSLLQVPGCERVLEEKQLRVLVDNTDVYVDSNLGLKCSTESVGMAMQIVLLVPDANGDYNLKEARALVRPGAQYAEPA